MANGATAEEANGYVLALYNPAEFHAQNHFSMATVGHVVDFFEETLGAPNPMPGSNQTWWLKEAFNLVGLIGFFGAIVPFAALMLEPSILPDVLFA